MTRRIRPDDTAELDPGCGEPGTSSFPNAAGTRCMFSYRDDWNLFNKEQRILAYGLRVRLRAAAGRLALGMGGTYTFRYVIPETAVPDLTLEDDRAARPDGCADGECDVAGRRNQNNFGRPLPRLRMRVPLTWSVGGHVTNVALNYISGYKDDANYGSQTGELDSIAPWATIDLSYSYILGESQFGMSTQVRVGVNNLLDTDPPWVRNANFGYDIFTHDPRGRILYANPMHKF